LEPPKDLEVKDVEKEKSRIDEMINKSALIRKINDAILFQPTALENEDGESSFDETEFLV
jgi:hypothetical protein